MIESEEKRKRIKEMLERWSKHCKIHHLLRDGDVPGLADSIIQEFYHMKLCCGHWVNSQNEGIDLEMDEYDYTEDGPIKGTSSGIYCKECAEYMLKKYKDSCRKI